MFIYKQTEFSGRDGADLWTVGHMEGDKFEPESDHSSKYDAAARCIELNGGGKYVEKDERPAKAAPAPSKGQHTPGQWSYDFLDEENGWILDQHSNYIAEIVTSDEEGKFIRNGKERVANARLMAAAPELLEALKLTAKHSRELLHRDAQGMLGDFETEVKNLLGAIIETNEEAIRKATEGQQS